MTVGMRGAHVTVGRTGIRKTVGIPGTGIYYTSHTGYHSGVHTAHVDSPISDGWQAAAHAIGQFLFILLIVGAFAVAIAVLGSLGAPKPG